MSDIFSAKITVIFDPTPSKVRPVPVPAPGTFTGIGNSTESPDIAEDNAYTNVKNAILNNPNNPKTGYYKNAVKVLIQLSDKYTSNGVSSIITGSGSGTATCTDQDIFTMMQNAYDSAKSAADDSLDTYRGLLDHADFHSQDQCCKE